MTDAKLKYSLQHSVLVGGVAQLVESLLSTHKFNPQYTRHSDACLRVPISRKWMETERSGVQGQMDYMRP